MPRPESVSVTVHSEELFFTWSSLDYSCPSLLYRLNASASCGRCGVTATNSTMVFCSGFSVSVSPKICEFSVHYVVCGNITGEAQTTTINLQGKYYFVTTRTIPFPDMTLVSIISKLCPISIDC